MEKVKTFEEWILNEETKNLDADDILKAKLADLKASDDGEPASRENSVTYKGHKIQKMRSGFMVTSKGKDEAEKVGSFESLSKKVHA